MLRRLPLAMAVSMAAVYTAAGPVSASDDPVLGGDCQGTSKFVTVCRQDPGTGTSGSQQQGGDPKGGSGKANSKPTPQTCTVEKLDPQPPANDPVWDGHKPRDGAIYVRVCLSDALGAAAGAQVVPQVFWAAGAPAVNVDPEQLAREAVDKMLLTGPDIASPRAAGRYVVGMPMWMWVDQSATTYGPNSAAASLAGVTVTATAKVSSISWNMGDGTDPVVCNGPGTKYESSMGKTKSPDCGHLYEEASTHAKGGKFHGTATATWTVNWQVTAGPAENGQFNEVRQTNFTVDVHEVQVLN
ncbi:ATP/GTP-binding protein [Streptomyces sp. NPDC050523]|uniref:ATP/GTP-binding protein n=1 Tax=Streptomyces sp. NPDC050523 TaxID=3365622 RepID=UPI0037AB4F6A